MSEHENLDRYDKISVEWDDASEEVLDDLPQFPKYTTQLMNIANQNAQGTRPEVVGQMSELIQECPETGYDGWRRWYQRTHPDAIDRAVGRIMPMLENFREALDKIDEEMVRDWVTDLVINKTAEGLIIQEAVLRTLAEEEGVEWSLAGPSDESKNIDGYIDGRPVSIKPESYMAKKSSVQERIDVTLIFYKKTRKYLHVYKPPAEDI